MAGRLAHQASQGNETVTASRGGRGWIDRVPWPQMEIDPHEQKGRRAAGPPDFGFGFRPFCSWGACLCGALLSAALSASLFYVLGYTPADVVIT